MVTSTARGVLFVTKSALYIGLAMFMVFLAVRTYQFSGGFADVHTLAAVVGLLALGFLTIRIVYISIGETLHADD